ncbi:hypothetical protein GY45DRAFT_575974 [Cubamyces sp. BRFM 1775]|nr:hypothetical protein GY45DRAFT_575974 [Cubamyces sp. BRFM 1775]
MRAASISVVYLFARPLAASPLLGSYCRPVVPPPLPMPCGRTRVHHPRCAVSGLLRCFRVRLRATLRQRLASVLYVSDCAHPGLMSETPAWFATIYGQARTVLGVMTALTWPGIAYTRIRRPQSRRPLAAARIPVARPRRVVPVPTPLEPSHWFCCLRSPWCNVIHVLPPLRLCPPPPQALAFNRRDVPDNDPVLAMCSVLKGSSYRWHPTSAICLQSSAVCNHRLAAAEVVKMAPPLWSDAGITTVWRFQPSAPRKENHEC